MRRRVRTRFTCWQTVHGRVAPTPSGRRAGGYPSSWGVAIKQWSSAQTTAALSSGEAEYISLVFAAPEDLGAQALVRDLGWKRPVVLYTDFAAAKRAARLWRRSDPAHCSLGLFGS